MIMALLTDRTALVTGGGRGIGEASARKLAENGAKVILADMNLETAQAVAEDICTQGSQAKALKINVAEFDKIAEKITQAKAVFGRSFGSGKENVWMNGLRQHLRWRCPMCSRAPPLHHKTTYFSAFFAFYH